MTRLTNEPYLIPVLRKEAMEVLSADGLSKAALANLKIMDSTLKEALQLCPTTCRKYSPSTLQAHDATAIANCCLTQFK